MNHSETFGSDIHSGKPFVERETFSLESGGELEVFVREDDKGIYSYQINVRSAEEKAQHDEKGEYYYADVWGAHGPTVVTGGGSTEGLLRAKTYLVGAIERLRGFGAKELWVDGDERRMNIYRRALTPMGFIEGQRPDGETGLVYRFE
jgi:hypothetical protein